MPQPTKAVSADEAGERVRDLPDDEFATLVRTGMGKESQIWDVLLEPAVVRRTDIVTAQIRQDVQTQLAFRAAELEAFRHDCYSMPDGKERWFEAQAEHKRWRRSALGFMALVDRRRAEVKQALLSVPGRGPAVPMDESRRVRLMATIFELGRAIRVHQLRTRDLEINAEQHDRDLWDALDAVLVQTVDGPIPVSKMLDDSKDMRHDPF